MLGIQQDNFYDEVEWLDTDASEDEDYLPLMNDSQDASKQFFLKTSNPQDFLDDVLDRKRNRMNSLSWDINSRDLFRRKLTISTETPSDKVRKAIDKTIDDGIERVDIRYRINKNPSLLLKTLPITKKSCRINRNTRRNRRTTICYCCSS